MEVTELMNTSIEFNQLDNHVATLMRQIDSLRSENKALQRQVHKIIKERDAMLVQKQRATTQIKTLMSRIKSLISKEKECLL